MNHVLTSRPDYSRINPDSPWRWVPLVAMPFVFVAIDLVVRAASTAERHSSYWLLPIVLGVSSLLRRTPGAAYEAAVEREKATNGRRIVTRPGLALGMLAVGIVMLGTWIVATVARDDFEATPLAWVPYSFAVPAIGLYLAKFGMERPWDLKVVEREHAAE